MNYVDKIVVIELFFKINELKVYIIYLKVYYIYI